VLPVAFRVVCERLRLASFAQEHCIMSTAPSTYADMTNTIRLHSSLRRLFSGQIDEILGEIFQNSQRARAHHVAITTTPDGFTVSDDGHGLRASV
jgi:hypothetical protein